MTLYRLVLANRPVDERRQLRHALGQSLEIFLLQRGERMLDPVAKRLQPASFQRFR